MRRAFDTLHATRDRIRLRPDLPVELREAIRSEQREVMHQRFEHVHPIRDLLRAVGRY
jgi:hypothetical protein